MFSSGHVECSFDNTIEKKIDKKRKVFHSVSENDEIFMIFSSKCSPGQVECSFDIRVKNFSSESQKIFAQCPKMMEKYTFSQNSLKLGFFRCMFVNLENLEVMMKKQKYFEKKSFSLKKEFLPMKAQDMPVVAGRLVKNTKSI